MYGLSEKWRMEQDLSKRIIESDVRGVRKATNMMDGRCEKSFE